MRTGHNVTQQKRASNDRTDAQPVNQTTTKKIIKRMSCVSTKELTTNYQKMHLCFKHPLIKNL